MRKNHGSITVVCGCMFAGKTEEVIRRARRGFIARKKVQVFKPDVDKRYDEEMVVTHMGVRHEATPVSGVLDLIEKTDEASEIVLVEEAQFFDASIVTWAIGLARRGVDVVLAGLDQDFRGEPFGPMGDLLAVADEVIKLQAICMKCGRPATHTQRLVNGKPAKWDDEIVLIGANESYEARCRSCHEIKRPRR